MPKKKVKISPRFLPPVLISLAGVLYAWYQISDYQTTRAKDMQVTVSQIEGKINSKKGELKQLQDFVGNIEKIKAEYRELTGQLEKSLESMPATFELSNLLRQFTLLAQNTGIEMAYFKPKGGEQVTPGTFYSSQVIEVEFKGAFTQTLLFLDQLSRLKRIVNIETISMSAGDSDTLGAVPSTTKAVVRTYRYVEAS